MTHRRWNETLTYFMVTSVSQRVAQLDLCFFIIDIGDAQGDRGGDGDEGVDSL